MLLRTLVFCVLLSVYLVHALPSLLDGDHAHDHHDHDHAHDHDHHDHHDHSHDHHGPAASTAANQQAAQPDASAKARASEVNDGGRLLSLPDAQACANRPKQWQFNGKWYFLTTNTTEYKDNKSDWLDGRNLCRKHCMDLVSLETQAEHNMVIDVIEKENLPYIWTSGRLCNFKGCDRPDLQPLITNGWFWSASGVKVAPTNVVPPSWTAQPWSGTGHFKRPQPDNAEFEINKTTEACLAILNNVYKDGIHWHDIACYHTKPVICEDNDELLKYIAATHPNLKL